MKLIQSFAVLLFTLVAAPAFANSTNIVVTPEDPVDCHAQDYPHVNWVYNIEKLSETNDQVVFQFSTKLGACVNHKVVPEVLHTDLVLVDFIQNNFLLPWQKDPGSLSAAFMSPTELRVTLTFDKTRIFKTANREGFELTFYPYGAFSSLYTWDIELTTDSGVTAMHFL
jgi:hypothetical protein